MSIVHEIAKNGFGAGTNDLYDRVRPTYQPFTLEHIYGSIRTQPGWNVVEIGSGTGIFTRTLLEDPKWNGSIKELKAIEPSEGMREVFTKRVHDERISLSAGTFQDTGVTDGWADFVVIAQAFHWCPDYEQSMLEFSRILKPEGVVVFVWNLEDRDGATWVARVRDTIEAFERDTPQFRHMFWRKTFDTPGYQREFAAPEEIIWSYTLEATEELVVDRASSKSYVAILPPDKKKEVQNQIRDILKEEKRVWIDEERGVFEYPYKAWVVVAKKKSIT